MSGKNKLSVFCVLDLILIAALWLVPGGTDTAAVRGLITLPLILLAVILFRLMSRIKATEENVLVESIEPVSQMNPSQYISKGGYVCAGSDGRYHVSFLLENETRLTLSLSAKQSGSLAPGMKGTLVHNGPVFLSFQSGTQQKPKKKGRLAAGILLLCFLAAGTGCTLYLNDYYHAQEEALEVLRNPSSSIAVSVSEHGEIIFLPENPAAGLIFYPGAKVQCEAYAPLMEKLAEQGFLCILVPMPGNLAILNPNAADGLKEDWPQVESWYLGGHSLGGAMAASYLSGHPGEYQGLILLAAYSTKDLSQSGLQVLSVYGSEDGVLNRETYAFSRSNLPADTREVILEGGCHAFFGDYGTQDGDGIPTITRKEQMEQTALQAAALLPRRNLTENPPAGE